MKAANYYAGHQEAEGAVVTVTRSGRTKPLDPRLVLRNHSPTGFAWDYGGSGPAQLALALLSNYFGATLGGRALAEALYQPFKFAVIAVLPQPRWKMSFEEIGIALCRMLTERPDLFAHVISQLEFAIYDEAESEDRNAANLSSAAIGERIAGILSEAVPMSRAFAERLVEQHYNAVQTHLA